MGKDSVPRKDILVKHHPMTLPLVLCASLAHNTNVLWKKKKKSVQIKKNHKLNLHRATQKNLVHGANSKKKVQTSPFFIIICPYNGILSHAHKKKS